MVNLPYVAVLNRGFGVDLDSAFGRSFTKPTVSLDQAAIMWMVTVRSLVLFAAVDFFPL